MPKILNLDKLVKGSDRKLTINGVDHEVIAMTVENFVHTTRSVEELIAKGGNLGDQVECTIDVICSLVPTAPREALRKYEVTMLNTIASFVRGEDVDEQTVESTEEGK